jgi:FAD/FMN-containing dehydrogenase
MRGPLSRTARAGGGVTWQTVLDAATPHGLAPMCGSAPAVGVVGYLTGGGIGPLIRNVGLSADHARAFAPSTDATRLARCSTKTCCTV